MRILSLVFASALLLLASCKSHDVTNEYRDAKSHPSEEIAKGHKKAAKKAQRDFVKNQKANKKAINKKNSKFFKTKR